MGIIIAPLYTSEISPASVRGALVSLAEIALNVGILLGGEVVGVDSRFHRLIPHLYIIQICIPFALS